MIRPAPYLLLALALLGCKNEAPTSAPATAPLKPTATAPTQSPESPTTTMKPTPDAGVAPGPSADDPRRAVRERACSKGFLDACEELATTSGTPWETAEPLLARACTGGLATSCFWLGFSGPDAGRALTVPAFAGNGFAELYERACKGASADGCTRLCLMKSTGTKLAEDKPGARRFCEVACAFGSGDSCAKIGAERVEGGDVSKYLIPACAAKVWSACARLADGYEHGDGVKKDKRLARATSAQACKAGIAGSCQQLASMTDNGEGGVADKAGAMALYVKACEGADISACDSVADRIDAGYHDAATAAAGGAAYYRAQACALGSIQSCKH